MKFFLGIVNVFLALSFAPLAMAYTIADFESDPLSSVPGAPVSQVTGNVTVEDVSTFIGSPPADCSGSPTCLVRGKFAYLTTGPGSNGGGDSGMDRSGANGNERDVATMTITFNTATSGSLQWGFVIYSGDTANPDIVEIRVDGARFFAGSVGADNGSFPAMSNFFTGSWTGPGGATYNRVSGLSSILPIAAGNHTLEVFVGDEVDASGDTAVLFDNLVFQPDAVAEARAVPALNGVLLGVLSLLLGIAGWRLRRI